jgi:hypothetical protein
MDYALTVTVYTHAESEDEAKNLGWRLVELLEAETEVDSAKLDSVE